MISLVRKRKKEQDEKEKDQVGFIYVRVA